MVLVECSEGGGGREVVVEGGVVVEHGHVVWWWSWVEVLWGRRADGGQGTPHHQFLCGGAVGPGSWFGRVSERETRGVNHPVGTHQGHGDLGGLPHPQPLPSEGRNVGDHAQHALLAPEHRLGLHVPEPDTEVGRKVITR